MTTTAAVTAVCNAASDLRGMCSEQGRTDAENVILANIGTVLAELERTEGDLAVAVREAVTARAEVERLRAELREATKSTLGWRQWVMRERDAALAAVQAVRDELDEKHRAELAEEGRRWAAKAEELYDSLGVVMDICEHATPIARDADGFVATGYTITVGAIHRALAYLQGALHNPPKETAQTWAEFQAWLMDERRAALGTVGQPLTPDRGRWAGVHEAPISTVGWPGTVGQPQEDPGE